MNQNLRKEMQSYSNERILNNINQQNFFSPESVAIAKEIAQQRNLLNETQINQVPASIPRTSTANYSKSNDSGISVFGVLFIIFVIVKLFIRIAMYNS